MPLWARQLSRARTWSDNQTPLKSEEPYGCVAARWASNAVRSPWFLPGAPAGRRTELARSSWPSVGLERGAAMLATVFGGGHRVFSLVNALFHGYKNTDGASR